jgi:Putative helicase
MLRKIFSFFGGRSQKQAQITIGSAVYDLADMKALDDYSERLPGFSEGIPVIPVELLVNKNESVIKQVILARGLSGKHNKEQVEAMIMSPIRSLAEMTHLLPASENDHFKSPGGLFTFCLEVSLHSVRYAERRILTRVSPEIRKTNESLWAHAAFLNGLFSEAILAISRISVYAQDSGIEWRPGGEPLYGWLRQNNLKRYHIRWNGNNEGSKHNILAGKVITKEQEAILKNGEWAITDSLHGALHHPRDLSNPLAKINDQVRYKIMERDMCSYSNRYGKPLAGMHLEPWLIDAMRNLIQKKRWLPNEDNGRIWHGLDGIFLVWPLVANDMQYQLKESECPFVPGTGEILAEIMLDAGIIESSGDINGYLFDIAVPVAESPGFKYFEALKVTRPEILFVKIKFIPLVMNLIVEREEEYDEDEDDSNGQRVKQLSRAVSGTTVDYLKESDDPGLLDDIYEKLMPVPEGKAEENGADALNRRATKKNTHVTRSTPTKKKLPTVDTGTDALSHDAPHPSDVNPYDDEYAADYNPGEALGYGGFNPVTAVDAGNVPVALSLPKAHSENTANVIQETTNDLLAALIGSSPSTAKPHQANKGSAGQNSQEIDGLFNPPKVKVASPPGRSAMILGRFKNIPVEFLEARPGGITKVIENGLKTINLELKDCVPVLKEANLLALIDGNVSGIDTNATPKSRYILVKADLLHEKN